MLCVTRDRKQAITFRRLRDDERIVCAVLVIQDMLRNNSEADIQV